MAIKRFFYINIGIVLAFLTVQGHAADFKAVTSNSPAQILIQNALIKTALGNKYASIQLVAKDNKNLHEGQVYQIQLSRTNTDGVLDGAYDIRSKRIFIKNLLQADSMSHQTTLKQINGKPLEFVIVELNTSVIKSSKELFFDSSAMHQTEYRNLIE